MKKFTIQLIALTIVIFASLFIYKSQGINFPFSPKSAIIKELMINDAHFKVEIADTKEKRAKGLGGREALASDEGMLFIFEKAGKYPFWMKGLTFPLDFIWIMENKIVDIIPNVQPPSQGTKDESLQIYEPKVDADKVLEVNGGSSERSALKIGDTIKFQESP